MRLWDLENQKAASGQACSNGLREAFLQARYRHSLFCSLNHPGAALVIFFVSRRDTKPPMTRLRFLGSWFAYRCILPPSVTSSFVISGGGDVKIESQKLNFKEKAQAKVGSLDNVGHLPAGGAVKVVIASPV